MSKKKTTGKPKPGGRPRIPGARRLTFCIRVSEVELAALEAAAEKTTKPLRVWARERILRGLKIPPPR